MGHQPISPDYFRLVTETANAQVRQNQQETQLATLEQLVHEAYDLLCAPEPVVDVRDWQRAARKALWL